jgi:hypothetical protein
VGVWAAVLLGVAVHGYFHPLTHTVYDIYGPAARKWWAGADLYVLDKDHYRYSPLFAISLTPFAVLPDCWGNALWKVANALALAAGLGVWLRHGLPVRLSRARQAAVFLLVLPLVMHSLHIGQANLLMLGAVLFGAAAAARERWTAAAAWLAAATLIKGYPLALALLLAGLYPRRFALRFAAALAVGLLLPFAAQAPGVVVAQYASWFHHLGDSQGLMCDRMRSLIHLRFTYGNPLPAAAFTLLGALTGAAVFAGCLLQNQLTDDRREQVLWALMLFSAWGVLFGPFTEACTYALVGPVVAWQLVDAFRQGSGWLMRLALIACLILMGPAVTDLVGARLHRLAELYAVQPMGALLFLGCVMTRAGRCTGPADAEAHPPAAPSLSAAA